MLPLIFDTCVPRYEFYWEIEIMKVADLTYLLTRSQALPGNAYQEALPPIFLSHKQSGASLISVPRQSLGTS